MQPCSDASAQHLPEEGVQPCGTTIAEVYDMWCTLLDLAEDSLSLDKVARLLAQGGEVFRSFLQFIARNTEPHRGEVPLQPQAWEDEALRRSCVAMQIACRALAGAPSGQLAGTRVPSAVCCELLGGLQPEGRSCSLHICTVLQHLLSEHDREVTEVLLQYHTPFLLLRLLDHPGCSELLLGLVLGCDSLLLQLLPERRLRPLCPQLLQQVLGYLQAFKWTKMVEWLAHPPRPCSRSGDLTSDTEPGSGNGIAGLGSPDPARLSGGSPGAPRSPSSKLRTPARRRNEWPSPGTPGWPSHSLGDSLSTPQRSALQRPTSTPSRRSSPSNSHEASSPLCLLLAPPSSPSPSQEPLFGEPPPFPSSLRQQQSCGTCSCEPTAPVHSAAAATAAAIAVVPSPARARAVPTSQRGSAESSSAKSPELSVDSGSLLRTPQQVRSSCSATGSPIMGFEEEEIDANGRGIAGLVEFLNGAIDASGRASEALRRYQRVQLQRQQQQQQQLDQEQQPIQSQQWDSRANAVTAEEAELDQRAEAREQLLHMMFLETSLIAHFFGLLHAGTAPDETAMFLYGLLRHTMNPRRCSGAMTEPLLALYLPHVQVLNNLLLQGALYKGPGTHGASKPPRKWHQERSELRLNAYTVKEPLGTLRVVAVQILSTLCELTPQRLLPLIKPAVWAILVQWFLTHRCNHIFQAACSRIWVALVQHGGAKVQHFVFARHRLLNSLCDVVLSEGACGDHWHEVRAVRTDRKGSEVGEDRTEKAQVAECRRRHPGGLGSFVPVILALEMQAAEDADAGAQEASLAAQPSTRQPSFLNGLLATAQAWPQVLGAVGRSARLVNNPDTVAAAVAPADFPAITELVEGPRVVVEEAPGMMNVASKVEASIEVADG